MTKSFFVKSWGVALLILLSCSAQANLTRQIHVSDLTTTEGRQTKFGDGFFTVRDLTAEDPFRDLLSFNAFQSQGPDEIVYVGLARYQVGLDSRQLTSAIFENEQYLSYLQPPTDRMRVTGTNPLRLDCVKSIGFGFSVSSQEVVRTFEASDIAANPTLSALVRKFKTRNQDPVRVVMATFDHFSQTFDSAVMFSVIYSDGPGQSSIELYSISLIHLMPPLVGRGFVSRTAQHDFLYYVDRISAIKAAGSAQRLR